MSAHFEYFGLRLVSPDFDTVLTDTLMEPTHLRKLKLRGTPPGRGIRKNIRHHQHRNRTHTPKNHHAPMNGGDA
ncbi:MAG: hypothetical protein ACQEQV_04360 [Fibrobacterota bacterium]